MKKLNQAWVFSDSIKGHELQSQALANEVCTSFITFHCGLRQPWLSFAPRVLAGFGRNIIWKNKQKPDIEYLPEVIITTGRRMAAVGKYYKRKYKLKHIQILNPKDKPENYDVLICPEHDGLSANNVIQIKGSLHQFSQNKLKQLNQKWRTKILAENNLVLSLFIGNPGKSFFKSLVNLSKEIDKQYPQFTLFISASRRTPSKYKKKITEIFKHAKLIWFSEQNGKNPYLGMLSCSDLFLVTADSINMISETIATDKPVVFLGYDSISPKHKKFIDSLNSRVIQIGEPLEKTYKPIYSLVDVGTQVLKRLN